MTDMNIQTRQDWIALQTAIKNKKSANKTMAVNA
jgi:hypothetical protein